MQFNQAYDPFRALQSSWTALKKAPLPLLIGGGILLITGGGGGSGGNFGNSWKTDQDVDWNVLAPVLLGILGIVCCLGLVFFLISSWVRIGFANTVEEVLRTGQGDVGRVFDGKGRLFDMILSRLLCAVISIAAVLPYGLVVLGAAVVSEGFERNREVAVAILIVGALAWLPVIFYVGLGTLLAEQAVALEGLKPVASVRRSWSLVRGHRWMLFWYAIVTSIFTVLGVCACCIGIFVTGTMAEIARTESFLALTRGAERDGWWIQTGRAPAATEPGWGSPSPSPSPTPGASWPSQHPGWGAPPPPPPPSPPST